MREGSAPVAIRWATRWASVLVLPDAGAGDDEQRARQAAGGRGIGRSPKLLGIEAVEPAQIGRHESLSLRCGPRNHVFLLFAKNEQAVAAQLG